VSRPGGGGEIPEIVRRAQAGDQDAFHALYREQAGRVYALCLRMSGDRSSAEELTQDVFVRVWQKLRTFRGESAFSTWLHRLATNVALMAQRARTRRERRVEPVEDPAVFDRGTPAAPIQGIDLEQALARLPAGAREVFVLHDVEGYGHAEIGRLLGIAEGTSKAQLFRARRLLRGMLER
jgi:RNA polymerase sigma-70 factor (ECF subfamily)